MQAHAVADKLHFRFRGSIEPSGLFGVRMCRRKPEAIFEELGAAGQRGGIQSWRWQLEAVGRWQKPVLHDFTWPPAALKIRTAPSLTLAAVLSFRLRFSMSPSNLPCQRATSEGLLGLLVD